MAEHLTAAEDEELRRLAALSEYGRLTPETAALYDELRQRDRRGTVRPPRALAIPVQSCGHDEERIPARR